VEKENQKPGENEIARERTSVRDHGGRWELLGGF